MTKGLPGSTRQQSLLEAPKAPHSRGFRSIAGERFSPSGDLAIAIEWAYECRFKRQLRS